MKIRINKDKLDMWMRKRKYRSYKEMGLDAQAKGLPLMWRTIYAMVNGGNWQRDKLESLCTLLGCVPEDIVDGWTNGDIAYTHVTPRSEEELQTA